MIAPGSVHYSPDGTAGQVTAIKTNYDFIAQANGVNRYNWWRNTTTGTRYIFGENSDATLVTITDGTSNTLMMGSRRWSCSTASPRPGPTPGGCRSGSTRSGPGT